MSERDTRNDRLREMLRRGDPERDGQDPSPNERATLRRLITETAGSSSPPAWGRLPVLASALAVVALLAVASLFLFGPGINDNPPEVAGPVVIDQPATARGTTDTDTPAVADSDPSGSTDNDAPPTIRNVQFVTRGGTRIVWVLNRNLNI